MKTRAWLAPFLMVAELFSPPLALPQERKAPVSITQLSTQERAVLAAMRKGFRNGFSRNAKIDCAMILIFPPQTPGATYQPSAQERPAHEALGLLMLPIPAVTVGGNPKGFPTFLVDEHSNALLIFARDPKTKNDLLVSKVPAASWAYTTRPGAQSDGFVVTGIREELGWYSSDPLQMDASPKLTIAYHKMNRANLPVDLAFYFPTPRSNPAPPLSQAPQGISETKAPGVASNSSQRPTIQGLAPLTFAQQPVADRVRPCVR